MSAVALSTAVGTFETWIEEEVQASTSTVRRMGEVSWVRISEPTVTTHSDHSRHRCDR